MKDAPTGAVCRYLCRASHGTAILLQGTAFLEKEFLRSLFPGLCTPECMEFLCWKHLTEASTYKTQENAETLSYFYLFFIFDFKFVVYNKFQLFGYPLLHEIVVENENVEGLTVYDRVDLLFSKIKNIIFHL